jgi:hypothetical protein
VALLFAGSSTQTIGNRIDLVLSHFGVSVDGGAAAPPPPPAPLDIAITSVSAPGSVIQGASVNVAVTVENVGTEGVNAGFDVTLRDVTDDVTIGTPQSVAGLAVGATTTLTFGWNTGAGTTGSHTLTASHGLVDDDASNNQRSTSVTVNAPTTAMHVGDLDGFSSSDGTTWSAIVEITVHDANHNPLNGAEVRGTWSRNGLNSNTCTSGDLGGDGTCIVLFPGLRRSFRAVTFTVTSVTLAGRTYDQLQNHDVDGSSNGTSIKVNRP